MASQDGTRKTTRQETSFLSNRTISGTFSMETSTHHKPEQGLVGQAIALFGMGLWWTATLLLGMFALIEGFSNRTFWGFLTAAFAAALCAPPVQRKLRNRTGPEISPQQFMGGAAVVLVISLVFMGQGKHAIQEAIEQEALVAKEAAQREAHAKLKHQFADSKAQIISKIEDLIAANKPVDALAEIDRYASVASDPVLARLKERAHVATMKLELRNEYSLALPRREEIYSRLISAEPAYAANYETKLREVRAELAGQQRIEAAASAAAAKKSAIAAQFSSWNGSHHKVEAALKARMHNPDSYKHVETRYSVDSDTITVITTYRGTNGFGAVVTSRALATTDLRGNVLSVESL